MINTNDYNRTATGDFLHFIKVLYLKNATLVFRNGYHVQPGETGTLVSVPYDINMGEVWIIDVVNEVPGPSNTPAIAFGTWYPVPEDVLDPPTPTLTFKPSQDCVDFLNVISPKIVPIRMTAGSDRGISLGSCKVSASADITNGEVKLAINPIDYARGASSSLGHRPVGLG